MEAIMAATTNIFTAVGNGTSATGLYGTFNCEVRGSFVGTVQLTRSLDGTNWVPVTNAVGQYNSFDKPASFVATAAETSEQWRFEVTDFKTGTIYTRISQ